MHVAPPLSPLSPTCLSSLNRRPIQALETVEAALADDTLSSGDRLALQRRWLRLGACCLCSCAVLFCCKLPARARACLRLPTAAALPLPHAKHTSAGKPPRRWRTPAWKDAALREPPVVEIVGRPINSAQGQKRCGG